MTKIKFVEAKIMRGAAVILRGMASLLSNVPDILHVQNQFFEIFLSVLGFSKGKNTFGLVAKKLIITF